MNSRLLGRNLTGNIPAELASLTGLVELWLDGNVLSGHIPALGACLSLRNIHLENNKLTGDLSFLDGLSNLQELYVLSCHYIVRAEQYAVRNSTWSSSWQKYSFHVGISY
ncbi:hypothetical protein ZIOFF_018625 [Zingiber officinale]|uniref:Uncharacterized protein n=1 Tax=Zingiber officinale TaxID=94328 RepID=A0A8J5LM90_ZINOF|nr:hypothetical protein ZIOFF_018625 [Zingiber officinale]